MLSWSHCVGVLGGYEYSAYYIFGFDDKGHYFYLDPHYTQVFF